MERIGYMAKANDGAMFNFEIGADDTFYIIRNGIKIKANQGDYEILEVGFFTANEPAPEMGYHYYLMLELAKCYGIIPMNGAYDEAWGKAQQLYAEFQESDFDDANFSEYECIENFLRTKAQPVADFHELESALDYLLSPELEQILKLAHGFDPNGDRIQELKKLSNNRAYDKACENKTIAVSKLKYYLKIHK